MSDRYATIVADPPWTQNAGSGFEGRVYDRALRRCVTTKTNAKSRPLAYPTMSVPEIKALPVADLAADDAHLYMWVTNKYIVDGYAIAEAWGFRPVALLTWAKTPMGMGLGGGFVQTTEHIVFARRGRDIRQRRIDTTWWNWKRQGRHSAKPEAFLDMVEQASPGPYLEMFARRARLGWDTWGNQALGGTDLIGDAA